jgi:hypothetical protein
VQARGGGSQQLNIFGKFWCTYDQDTVARPECPHPNILTWAPDASVRTRQAQTLWWLVYPIQTKGQAHQEMLQAVTKQGKSPQEAKAHGGDASLKTDVSLRDRTVNGTGSQLWRWQGPGRGQSNCATAEEGMLFSTKEKCTSHITAVRNLEVRVSNSCSSLACSGKGRTGARQGGRDADGCQGREICSGHRVGGPRSLFICPSPWGIQHRSDSHGRPWPSGFEDQFVWVHQLGQRSC